MVSLRRLDVSRSVSAVLRLVEITEASGDWRARKATRSAS